MDLRLLEPVAFYDNVDPGPDDPVDPDREPSVFLPAGAVLRDAEVDPADPSVGIRNDSVIGTYNGQVIGYFGPSARRLFVEHNDSDPLGFCEPQIAVTVAAVPHVARTLTERDPERRTWHVTVAMSTVYSTPHVEVRAVHNAPDVENGVDPEGFAAWWNPGSSLGGAWEIETYGTRGNTILWDSDHGDHPADGTFVASVALGVTDPNPTP